MHISRRSLLGAAGAAAIGTATGFALEAPAAAAGLRQGIDYSWGRPRPSAIVAAGYSFVVRYVSWNTTGKNLTKSEADALRAAGLDIVTNWEYNARDAMDGYNGGVADATEAHRQSIACGAPATRPIYFSVDFDATTSDQPTINAYFDGVASVIGRARTGAYGGYYAIKRLFDAGKITWGWQTYAWSGGNWDSRAQLRQVQNGITVDGADCDRNESHAVDFGQWGGAGQGLANIYGVLLDGRLTRTVVDAGTGIRVSTKISAAALGFTPKAMATLNDNTILITGGGNLYRIDVTNKDPLTFNTPVLIAGGWTHDHLAYDGNGHLFGIAAGTLRRYDITTPKPPVGTIPGNTIIGGGFNLKTLTATGPDWILGTTADGRLRSYKINLDSSWTGYTLRETSWEVFDMMLSPGGGVYFGHKPNGSVTRYVDANPYDGSSADLTNKGEVDAYGWTQVLLSAQPGTVA